MFGVAARATLPPRAATSASGVAASLRAASALPSAFWRQASRPARAVPVSDAQQGLGTLQQGRLENAQRTDKIKAEMRRQKEENVRVLTRLKQVGVERQQFQSMLQNAQVHSLSA